MSGFYLQADITDMPLVYNSSKATRSHSKHGFHWLIMQNLELKKWVTEILISQKDVQ
jgi:hypothetical protein